MILLKLALKSSLNRKLTVFLTVLSIALSVLLFLGVEKIRTQTQASFTQTVSGTDLIVGARSGPIQLLLYSVFRLGDATNNISYQTATEISQHPSVDWVIPISLGDSFKGYRVIGTTEDYFKYFRYGNKQALSFSEGKAFEALFDVVVGHEVANKLGLKLGDKITLAHGSGDVAFYHHDTLPFKIVGIINKTSTPVDRSVHVSLNAIEAIHIGWESGVPSNRSLKDASELDKLKLSPTTVTALFVGLKSRVHTFRLQRFINEYRLEPLTAILPGATLQQLWELLAVVETALFTISGLVLLVGLLGMISIILTTLNERRREMAILRSVGAGPWQIFFLLLLEILFLTLAGAACGLGLLNLGIYLLSPIMLKLSGISLSAAAISGTELSLLAVVISLAIVIGIIPAWRAMKNSLADGLTIRI